MDWKMEQARRVKGRGPVTATCRIADDRKLGVEGSGPRGDAYPIGLGARRGAGCNLGSQSRRCRSRLVLLAPLASPRPQPRRPLCPALTSGCRSPCRPEAEPQPREPPVRPSGAASCDSRSPHAPRPALEYGSSSTSGSRTADQGPSKWVPGVFSE